MVCTGDLVLEAQDTSYNAVVCFCSFPDQGGIHRLLDCLDERELRYFETLGSGKRRRSYLLGRYAAKTAVCRLTGRDDLPHIAIGRGIFGQPVIFGPPANIQVSISHSGNIGASVAFPEEVPMGIDIQMTDPAAAKALAARATDREKILLGGVPWPPDARLTLLWTAKEALSKAVKAGLGSYPVLEVEHIERRPDGILCRFRHLGRYRAVSFGFGDGVCSIAYPGMAAIRFNPGDLQVAGPPEYPPNP